MEKKDTIAVNVELEREIAASRVDFYVEIKGESLFSGKAALKKAREVRDLVAALSEINVPEEFVHLVGVWTEVATGVIGKSSSAVYRLRIEIQSLDLLADALGAVTSQKNSKLRDMDWHYDQSDTVHKEMLRNALQKAKERAQLICRELDHQNLGVHSLTEKMRSKSGQAERFEMTDYMFARKRLSKSSGQVSKEDLGLTIQHSKTLALDVRVEFTVRRNESDG